MRQFLLFLVILLVPSITTLSLAEEVDSKSRSKLTVEQLEELTQEMSETTMSPYCPGRTISSCPSIQARELRQQIYDWFRQGYSKRAVMNQLLAIYGEEVRGMPKSKGFGRMAWIAPGIFVLLGILFIVLYLKRRGLNQVTAFDDQLKVDEALIKKVNAELLERQSGK